MKQRSSRSHDELVVEMLRADPEFADVYLAAALEETEQPGGHHAMLTTLRHIAEAQGIANVAEKAGMPRESLYRALGPRCNPTIKTLLRVLNASGLHSSVARQHYKFAMKKAKEPDRITSELLEAARGLSKHNVLSTEGLNQVKALCTTPHINGKKSGPHPCTQGQDEPSRVCGLS